MSRRVLALSAAALTFASLLQAQVPRHVRPRGAVPDADVTVSKTGPATATAGSNVTFTIIVTNNGPGLANSVTLTDALPTFVGANQTTYATTFFDLTQSGPPFTCSNPGVGANGTVTCTAPSLGSGTSTTFALTITIPADAPPGAIFTNVATVSASNDPNSENNSASAPVTVPGGQADLTITKTGPAQAAANTDIVYTITASNNGPNPATNVVLSDTLESTTFQSIGNTAPFDCSTPAVGSGGDITCSASSLAAGASITFQLTVHVPAATPAGSASTNTAHISASSSDVNPENNNSTTATTIGSADVSVTKSGPESANAGSTISWTIVVANAGPDAPAVGLTDALPAGTTFVSLVQNSGPAATCSTPAFGANGTITCGYSSLPSGTSASMTLTAAIASTATGNMTFGTISNTATVTSSFADPNTTNNAATVTTSVTAIVDLSVTESGPATVTAGTDITYTIVAANAGPAAATFVHVTQAVPANTAFVSIVQNNGPSFNCAPHTGPGGAGGFVLCALSPFDSGSSATFTLVFHVDPAAATPIVSHLDIISFIAIDADVSNNTRTFTTNVTSSADLSLTKTASATATAGSNISYSVGLSNLGPSDAANSVVNDVLPANTTFVSLTKTSGPAFTCTTPAAGAGGTVNCTLPTFTAGTSATFTMVARVSPAAAAGPIPNTATVSSSTADPNSGNNTSTASTTVSQSADVTVSKTGPAAAAAGTNITYTIVVSNNGPSDATSVTMNDTLPPNTTFVSSTQTTGPAFTCTKPAAGAAGTLSCSIATLTSAASATFSLTVAVAPLAPSGLLTNTATVTASTADPNGGNNSSTASATISPSVVDLSITKTPNAPPYGAGYPLTYTIVTTNNGPNAALNVAVTDVLPAGTTFQSATPSSGTCSGTTTVTCNIGTLAANASATISLQLTMPATPGPLTNTATVTSSNVDTNPANNTATSTITVVPAAQIPALNVGALAMLAAMLAAIALLTRR